MGRKVVILVALVSINVATKLYSITVVYDLRVAQTTRHFILEDEIRRPFTLTALYFDQFRQTYDDVHEKAQGGMGTFISSTDSFYSRVDCAVGQVRTKKDGMYFSRAQTDDVLFSSGLACKIHDRAKFTLSGLVGLPTHNDLSLEGIQLGTGHVGLGAQLDGSLAYFLSHHKKQFFIAAARVIRFLPRDVHIFMNDKKSHFHIRGGNEVDLMVGHYTRWKNHRLELEYNPIFAFGANIQPFFDEKLVKRAHFIRSHFHIGYQHGTKFETCNSVIALRLTYAFDHAPKRLGVENSFTLWLLLGINF